MTSQPISSIPQGTSVLVTGASGFTHGLLTNRLAAGFGQKPRIVRLPAQPFFLLAGLCEAVCRPLGLVQTGLWYVRQGLLKAKGIK